MGKTELRSVLNKFRSLCLHTYCLSSQEPLDARASHRSQLQFAVFVSYCVRVSPPAPVLIDDVLQRMERNFSNEILAGVIICFRSHQSPHMAAFNCDFRSSLMSSSFMRPRAVSTLFALSGPRGAANVGSREVLI